MNTDQKKQKNMGELGRTLRALRIKRKWTLKDFEKASGFMIKDVVLGSYERGTRYISVSKLMIIASTYEVPMSTFFPTEISVITRGNIQPVIIDLRKLRESAKSIQSDTTILLQQFVAGVVNIRKDWNGEIISLRNSDLTNLSILTSQNAQDLFEHLRESKLLFDVKG